MKFSFSSFSLGILIGAIGMFLIRFPGCDWNMERVITPKTLIVQPRGGEEEIIHGDSSNDNSIDAVIRHRRQKKFDDSIVSNSSLTPEQKEDLKKILDMIITPEEKKEIANSSFPFVNKKIWAKDSSVFYVLSGIADCDSRDLLNVKIQASPFLVSYNDTVFKQKFSFGLDFINGYQTSGSVFSGFSASVSYKHFQLFTELYLNIAPKISTEGRIGLAIHLLPK